MKSWRSASTPVPRRSVSRERMSEAQPRTQQPQGKRLALADLRSVRWVASQPTVQDVYYAAKPRYLTMKQIAMVGWFIVINEMIMVWWWTFLHNLPWPQPALSLLDWTDSMTLRFLDYAQQRLEWVSGQLSRQVLLRLRPYLNRAGASQLFRNGKAK